MMADMTVAMRVVMTVDLMAEKLAGLKVVNLVAMKADDLVELWAALMG
jgi:hypothetical protein